MLLTRHNLTSFEYLATVTEMLQRIRLHDAQAGIYEAADLQWWWREDQAAVPERQIFWFDAAGKALACVLRYDDGEQWNDEFLCWPDSDLRQRLLPEVLAIIGNEDKATAINVRVDDDVLRNALIAAGFGEGAHRHVQTELVADPPRTTLPPGLRLTSRVEDNLPHHMMRRNGNEVAQRLRECSLYRPELDLCVRDGSDKVAGYVLFWMDDVTKVGLIEPVRTEQAFQRKGIARHIIAEGIARLRALGAESIRVTYDPGNQAAAALYHGMGFADRVATMEYRREPSQDLDRWNRNADFADQAKTTGFLNAS